MRTVHEPVPGDLDQPESVDGPDFQSAAAALRPVIGEEAMRFQLPADSDRLSGQEKESYRQLIRVDAEGEETYAMSDEVMTAGLKTLPGFFQTFRPQDEPSDRRI